MNGDHDMPPLEMNTEKIMASYLKIFMDKFYKYIKYANNIYLKYRYDMKVMCVENVKKYSEMLGKFTFGSDFRGVIERLRSLAHKMFIELMMLKYLHKDIMQ